MTVSRKYGNVVTVKTTIEIPDELYRQTKATAALRGESVKDLVTEALRNHLTGTGAVPDAPSGWRSVFGKATLEDVAEVDARIADSLERIDLDTWR